MPPTRLIDSLSGDGHCRAVFGHALEQWDSARQRRDAARLRFKKSFGLNAVGFGPSLEELLGIGWYVSRISVEASAQDKSRRDCL